MSRESILDKIRGALASPETDGARAEAVAKRLGMPPQHLKPARTVKPRADLIAQFVSYLEGQSARIVKLDTPDAVPAAIADYLRAANLPQVVHAGADPWLSRMPWSAVPGLTITHGRATPEDEVGLSRAYAGVAETGTLVLASGADNPVTLSFLPETHIVVIDEATIGASLEDGIDRARTAMGGMPRTLNLISGPSRTADIGGRIVIGAHGPRRLAVFIVRGGPNA